MVISAFSSQYLRTPNIVDVARILACNEARGFLGMLGSIDLCIGNGGIVPQLGEGNSTIEIVVLA